MTPAVGTRVKRSAAPWLLPTFSRSFPDCARDAIAERLVQRTKAACAKMRDLGEERALRAVQRELADPARPQLSRYLDAASTVLQLISELRDKQAEGADDSCDADQLRAQREQLAERLHIAARAHLVRDSDGMRLADRACAQLSELSALALHPPLMAEHYEQARAVAAEACTEVRRKRKPSDVDAEGIAEPPVAGGAGTGSAHEGDKGGGGDAPPPDADCPRCERDDVCRRVLEP